MMPPKRIIVGVIDDDWVEDRLFAVSKKNDLKHRLPNEGDGDDEFDGTFVWEYVRVRRRVARRKVKEQITITDR